MRIHEGSLYLPSKQAELSRACPSPERTNFCNDAPYVRASHQNAIKVSMTQTETLGESKLEYCESLS